MPRPANPDAPPKRKALYHLFIEEEDGALSPLGQAQGRNAEDAVATYLNTPANPEEEAPEQPNGRPFVIVPYRNFSRVMIEVETVQKVKLTST